MSSTTALDRHLFGDLDLIDQARPAPLLDLGLHLARGVFPALVSDCHIASRFGEENCRGPADAAGAPRDQRLLPSKEIMWLFSF